MPKAEIFLALGAGKNESGVIRLAKDSGSANDEIALRGGELAEDDGDEMSGVYESPGIDVVDELESWDSKSSSQLFLLEYWFLFE